MAGLDVSLDTVSVCIVDEQGKVVREQEVPSTPEGIGGFLLGTGLKITKIGLESGNLTHYLTKGLLSMKHKVVVKGKGRCAAFLFLHPVKKGGFRDVLFSAPEC